MIPRAVSIPAVALQINFWQILGVCQRCLLTLCWPRECTIRGSSSKALGFFLLLSEFFFYPMLGRHRFRDRCCAAIRLSHRPEPSGRVVHGEVDGLDIGGQRGRRFVLLCPTHRPQGRPYPICTSRSGNVRHRCRGLGNAVGVRFCWPPVTGRQVIVFLLWSFVYVSAARRPWEWVTSQPFTDEGGTVGSCRTNSDLFAKDLALLASSEQDLQLMHLIGL